MANKNFRLCISLLTVLTVVIVIFLRKPTIQSQQWKDRTVTVSPNVTQKRMEDMSQDDPDLISLIREQYLEFPAGPTEKLNLVKKIWRSPVLEVVHKILHNKTGGYFLECGAFDGEHSSNTIELEQYFNWQGVLVEADPIYKQQLLGKRRRAWIAPVCMSPKPHAMKVRMVRHRTHFTGVSRIPEYHPARPTDTYNYVPFEVQCFPLYSIFMAALNITDIDYLSLDVEGAEWQIIQTIPFDKLKIKVISLEVLKGSKYQDITEYLKSKGYVYQAKIEIEKLYIKDIVLAHHSVL